MNRAFSHIFSASLVIVCLTTQLHCQAQLPENKPGQQTAATPKPDLSAWQIVSLDGKGIKFKLPPEWRHDDFELENKNENFIIQEVEWNTPDKDNPNKELIRILVTTYPGGFVSYAPTAASKEEMVQEEFDRVNRSAQRKEDSPAYSEVKKVKVSDVEGVFRSMRVDFEDKSIGSREGLYWTGYRIYKGKAQEVEIILSSNPKRIALLRTIFSTLEVEQDKDAPRSRS